MNDSNINNSSIRMRILVAPLDWGLGHATRCIPVIKALINLNVEVVLAAEGNVALLLAKEFPNLKILPLKGYKILYSRRKGLFSMKILMQVPNILFSIRHERDWLNSIVATEKINAVISDNRFGLHHPLIPCVYITHQLSIQTGYELLNKLIRNLHYRYINKFDECWIPDNKNQNNLGGELSHPPAYPKTPVNYIGILSRCNKITTEKKYDFLLLISGPEPQRSIFEDMLLRQVEISAFTFAVVRGLPGNSPDLKIKNNEAKVFNHLPAGKLNALIQESEIVIARSGYSTIMDLARLQKKAVLIPTPGQKEQEYLAKYVMEKRLFHCVSQEDFSLMNVVEKMRSFQNALPDIKTEMDENIFPAWLQKVKTFTSRQ